MLLATMCLWFGEKKFNLEKPEAVSKRFRRLKGKNMRQRNNGMNGDIHLDLGPQIINYSNYKIFFILSQNTRLVIFSTNFFSFFLLPFFIF